MKQKKAKKTSVPRIAILVIGIIFLLWFMLPLFGNVTPNIGMLTGIGVFGLLTLYGIFFYRVNALIKKLWKKKTGRVVELICAVLLAVVFSLAAITYGCMLHAAAKAPLPNATVIVLGCKVNGYNPSLTLRTRLCAALSYLEENPNSLCIVTGAQGAGEITTEASVMYDWLVRQGIDASRVIVEDKASDTEENLRYSFALLEDRPDAGKQAAIVTSEFHMYRALSMAKEYAYECSALPAKTPWWLYPTYTVREMYGILEMWFLK